MEDPLEDLEDRVRETNLRKNRVVDTLYARSALVGWRLRSVVAHAEGQPSICVIRLEVMDKPVAPYEASFDIFDEWTYDEGKVDAWAKAHAEAMRVISS